MIMRFPDEYPPCGGIKKCCGSSTAFFCLGEKIRTSGLLNPIQARYQTAPHPDIRNAFIASLTTNEIIPPTVILVNILFKQNPAILTEKKNPSCLTSAKQEGFYSIYSGKQRSPIELMIDIRQAISGSAPITVNGGIDNLNSIAKYQRIAETIIIPEVSFIVQIITQEL